MQQGLDDGGGGLVIGGYGVARFPLYLRIADIEEEQPS
jgi:hypothetical protein